MKYDLTSTIVEGIVDMIPNPEKEKVDKHEFEIEKIFIGPIVNIDKDIQHTNFNDCSGHCGCDCSDCSPDRGN